MTPHEDEFDAIIAAEIAHLDDDIRRVVHGLGSAVGKAFDPSRTPEFVAEARPYDPIITNRNKPGQLPYDSTA